MTKQSFLSQIKIEVQICAVFAALFLGGLHFRKMYAASKMALGFVSYDSAPEFFTTWAVIWFGSILASLFYMHNKARKDQSPIGVKTLRFLIVAFIVLTGVLIIPYFSK